MSNEQTCFKHEPRTTVFYVNLCVRSFFGRSLTVMLIVCNLSAYNSSEHIHLSHNNDDSPLPVERNAPLRLTYHFVEKKQRNLNELIDWARMIVCSSHKYQTILRFEFPHQLSIFTRCTRLTTHNEMRVTVFSKEFPFCV